MLSSGVVWTAARFDTSFGNIFLMYMRIIGGLVNVAEWPPFGILLLPQCIYFLFGVSVISHFGFEGRGLVLVVYVPGITHFVYF